MTFRLLFIILVIAGVRIEKGDSCTTVNDGCYAAYVCASGSCSQCTSSSQCTSQHTIRTFCINYEGEYQICAQCSTNSQCGSGKTCITSGYTFLCGSTCTSPTSNCGSGSQCIYLDSQFYCMTCENNIDCHNWSGNSNSQCSSGVCSPAFLSCRQDSDCTNPASAYCSNSVCTACSSSSQCNHLAGTQTCNSGTCVQCASDSNCTDPTPYCSGSNTCVECMSDSYCAAPTPACSGSYTCVECISDSNCAAPMPHCILGSNMCVQCTSDPNCAAPTPACSGSYICVQCTSDSSCAVPTPNCNLGSNTCVRCTTNSNCAAPTPYCTESNTCVQCTSDSNCTAPTPACSGSYTCVQCTSNSNCAVPTPNCNLGSNICVQCTTNSNCAAPTPYCTESNTCVQCTSDSNCTAPTPYCSGSNTCVQCNSDPNCTAPTPYCSGSNTCVECTVNSQCSSAAAAQCSSNSCIACTGSDQCAHLDATPLCNLTSGACVLCLADSDCSSEASATQCSIANDCKANKTYPECNGTVCVACTDDASCQQLYNQSNMTCNVASGACAAVDPTTQSIATAFSNFASSAVVAIGGVAAIGTFAGGGGGGTASQSFTTLRITKIGILIRYVNIDFPYQTEKIFEAFSSSQSFIKTLLVGVFGDQQYNQTTIDLPTRFVKFGDSSLFLKNAGNTLLLFLIVIILIVINRILLYWARKKRNRTWIKRLLSLQKILEWNYILGYILATYPDLIVGLGLQFSHLPFSNPTLLSISSFVICAFIAPFAILFPLICNVLMRAENEGTRRGEYHNITRYKSLTSDFKENNSETKTYQMIGLLRIQAIVFPLIFWQSNPRAQILFMIVSSVVVNIFQITKVPFSSKFTSFAILTNELLLLICMIAVFLHIVLNSSGVETSNPKVTTILGWIITVVLLSLMSFNLLINVIEILQLIWRRLKPIIFRSKVPNQQKSSSRLSNRPLQRVPPSSLGNTSLNLSQTNNAIVDNNMSIRIRPRNMRHIQERF